MAKDPGLAADTCFFMEAVAGDGGAHNAGGVWWLSPDIKLVGPVSGPDKADPGQTNTVTVQFRRKSAASGCTSPFDENIDIELWVGNPSLAMAPNNPASTFNVQKIGVPTPPEGSTTPVLIDWIPPQGLPADDPQSHGHKCLIARCYPESLIPDDKSFHVPDDQHVAQHNICIVPCDAPGQKKHRGACGLRVTTLNLNEDAAETVTLRAVADLRPDAFVRRVVLSRLEKTPGFRRLAVRQPRSFRFEFADFPAAEVKDVARPAGCLPALLGISRPLGTSGPPGFEAKVSLRPGQLIHFHFSADLTGAALGDAYIFHLTQTGADGSPQGGLTVVMVAL
ncbi:MAG: hypothetical protein M3348_07795 [Acidobacteriota bacterium]|nr:hypothetical protein [Acidobacteriota bacterium]